MIENDGFLNAKLYNPFPKRLDDLKAISKKYITGGP
jgi:hypothetical protein